MTWGDTSSHYASFVLALYCYTINCVRFSTSPLLSVTCWLQYSWLLHPYSKHRHTSTHADTRCTCTVTQPPHSNELGGIRTWTGQGQEMPAPSCWRGSSHVARLPSQPSLSCGKTWHCNSQVGQQSIWFPKACMCWLEQHSPDEGPGQLQHCLDPKGRMHYEQASQVLPEAPVNHLVETPEPAKAGHAASRRLSMHIHNDIVINDNAIHR